MIRIDPINLAKATLTLPNGRRKRLYVDFPFPNAAAEARLSRVISYRRERARTYSFDVSALQSVKDALVHVNQMLSWAKSTADEVQASDAADGLPTLIGTPAQIVAASQIRRGLIARSQRRLGRYSEADLMPILQIKREASDFIDDTLEGLVVKVVADKRERAALFKDGYRYLVYVPGGTDIESIPLPDGIKTRSQFADDTLASHEASSFSLVVAATTSTDAIFVQMAVDGRSFEISDPSLSVFAN